jgi:Protein of unknown function (DUF1349)
MNRLCAVALLLMLLTPLQSPAQTKPPKLIEGWGNVIDKKNDSKLKVIEKQLTMTVGSPRNLNKVISDLSAPRVLQEVEGDFSPTPASAVAPRGKAYNGAGLLLWVDEDLFLRLERNIWVDSPGVESCHPPLFEKMVNGAPTGTSPPPAPANFFNTPSTWLRMTRQGDTVTGSVSHNGTDWTTGSSVTMTLPKKVSVGVAAVNTCKKSFKVTFEELRLTNE